VIGRELIGASTLSGPTSCTGTGLHHLETRINAYERCRNEYNATAGYGFSAENRNRTFTETNLLVDPVAMLENVPDTKVRMGANWPSSQEELIKSSTK
jgi:hypothetical protein